jgi:hypothetical protein
MRGPAKSPSRQAPDRSKFTSGKRRVSSTVGTSYGRAALESAIANMAEVTERSHGLFRNSCAMGNLIAGGQLEERLVVDELLRAADARGMNRRLAERTNERGVGRGKTTPRTPPPPRPYTRTDGRGEVIEWWEAVGRAEWTGRAAATDLRILAGFGLIGLRLGKTRFTASYRQLAEEAGVWVGTVHKTLERGLEGVHRVRSASRALGTSSEWQLVARHAHVGNSSAFRYGEGQRLFPGRASIDRPDHDLWSKWPQGWRVYNLLLVDEGLSVRSISETIGRHPGTVRRILFRLRDQQLAQRGEEGEWTALSPPEGVRDGGFVRRARERRHRDERKLWAQSRAGLIEKKWAAR